MEGVLQELNERIKALSGDWSKYTVVGSFLLYVVGYLALRFHLTAIGVGTDLAVLDERYLFTGANFSSTSCPPSPTSCSLACRW